MGERGQQGDRGLMGLQGIPGERGKMGSQGQTGSPGVSMGIVSFSSGIPPIEASEFLPVNPISLLPIYLLLGPGAVSTLEVVDIDGNSTNPTQSGAFSFPVPFDGTIQNLQVSADITLVSTVLINTAPLTYNFVVFSSPNTGNDNGSDQPSSQIAYTDTSLTTSVTFGGNPLNPIVILPPATLAYRKSTNITSSLDIINVTAGTRVGIRVFVTTDLINLDDLGGLSLSASFNYIPNIS